MISCSVRNTRQYPGGSPSSWLLPNSNLNFLWNAGGLWYPSQYFMDASHDSLHNNRKIWVYMILLWGFRGFQGLSWVSWLAPLYFANWSQTYATHSHSLRSIRLHDTRRLSVIKHTLAQYSRKVIRYTNNSTWIWMPHFPMARWYTFIDITFMTFLSLPPTCNT